jgi:pyridoxamine 5'-phosphate oxidase
VGTVAPHDQPVLLEDDVDPDPYVQFRRWFDAAVSAGVREPDAMTLATAARDGQPSARTVALRGFDERGFAFYTNFDSRKSHELAENPRAALVFHWREVERQVRVEGTVARMSPQESDAYFQSRPLPSRLSAWASPQGEIVADRAALDALYAEQARRFHGREPPRPPFWGGYRVHPVEFELWQGHADRLHDRLRYRAMDGRGWVLERLAP